MRRLICVYLRCGSGIAQLRYKKCEKAVSLPKISIDIFDVSKGGRG